LIHGAAELEVRRQNGSALILSTSQVGIGTRGKVCMYQRHHRAAKLFPTAGFVGLTRLIGGFAVPGAHHLANR